MSPFFQKVFNTFDRYKLPYILGGESLIGWDEGDLIKHSHHLRLYIFPIPLWKLVMVSLILMRHGIFLKPKILTGRLYYKIRCRQKNLKKKDAFISLTLLKRQETGFLAFLGGHDTFFEFVDLDQDKLDRHMNDGTPVWTPQDTGNFIKKYKTALLAGFYQKHSVSFDSKSEKQAVQFMHDNIAIMREAGIEFWIEGGTLLGALRDQKLIPWDHDLDFGMKFKSDNEMKQLIRKLKRHFYVSVKAFPKADQIWHLGDYRVLKIYPRKYLFFHEEMCLDLFVYYEGALPDSGELVYKYVVWNKNAFHRKEFFDTQEWIPFYGKDVPVPATPEKFIEVKYGETWRTPIKEWNVALDDGSIYKAE